MLVSIVAEKNTQAILAVLHNTPQPVDIIELRLDFLPSIELNIIAEVAKTIRRPFIITLRAKQHGGHFQGNEQQRLALLLKLASLHPSYMDIESHVNEAWISQLHQRYPAIKLIRSYHHLSHTPDQLDAILHTMQHPHVYAYKIVTHAQHALDGLRMMHVVKKHSRHTKLVGHCMGPHGLPSRIIGASLGNCFSYAQANGSNSPAPDCPDVDTMLNLYRIKQHNPNTRVYALLGNPVDHSLGHLFHNQQFSDLNANAVYVKIALHEKDLTQFFSSIKGLPFAGFSVTMPLKEAAHHYLHTLDSNSQRIGAVNTITLSDHHLHGTNTDGTGAVKAIEKFQPIANSNILILGAGGAAKAIAHACANRKPASLTIINRTLSKAETLAKQNHGKAYDLTSCKQQTLKHFDMVVDTLPHNIGHQPDLLAWLNTMITPNTILMPIDYRHTTSDLTSMAKAQGCTIIDPTAMFYQQAQLQRDTWLHKSTVSDHQT